MHETFFFVRLLQVDAVTIESCCRFIAPTGRVVDVPCAAIGFPSTYIRGLRASPSPFRLIAASPDVDFHCATSQVCERCASLPEIDIIRYISN